MYFANTAGVNVGVITTIWSVNPLFMAVADYLIYGQRLQYFHIIGLIAIVACTICISLSSVVGAQPAPLQANMVADHLKDPIWIPIVFGILTPVTFTVNGILTKHLTGDKMKFNPSTISFSAYLLVNIIVLLCAIPYWQAIPFSQYLFWIGLVGSVINTLGIVCIQNALSLGPAGPVSAIAAVASILLVIVEAVKHSKWLSSMESIGLVLGIYGALILVIPDVFERFCFCFCIKRVKVDS